MGLLISDWGEEKCLQQGRELQGGLSLREDHEHPRKDKNKPRSQEGLA